MTATDVTGFEAIFSTGFFATFFMESLQWRRRPEIADFCPLSWSNLSWTMASRHHPQEGPIHMLPGNRYATSSLLCEVGHLSVGKTNRPTTLVARAIRNAIRVNRFARIIRNWNPYFYSASGRFVRNTRISDSRESPDSRELIHANHDRQIHNRSEFVGEMWIGPLLWDDEAGPLLWAIPEIFQSVSVKEPQLISQAQEREGTQRHTPFTLPEMNSETISECKCQRNRKPNQFSKSFLSACHGVVTHRTKPNGGIAVSLCNTFLTSQC